MTERLFYWQGYTKLAKAYFSLVECLTQNHMVLLSSLDPSVVRQLFSAVVIGVDSVGESSLQVNIILSA